MSYFIIVNQEQIGPLSLEQLKQHHLYPETRIWREGLQDWVTAAQLSELSGLIKSKPPQYIVNSTAAADSNKYQTLLIIIAFYIVFNSLFWTMQNIFKPEFSGMTRYISLLTSTLHICIPIAIGIFTKNTVLKVLLICLGIIALVGSLYIAARWW